MFDKIHFVSIMDLIQMLGKAKGMFSFFGHKEEKPATPTSEVKGDENLPTGLISEKFTRADESHWQQLMLYLAAPVATIIRNIVTAMKNRDDKDGGSRVDSFRIGVLIMPNKLGEEVVSKAAKSGEAHHARRRGGKDSGSAEHETITRKIDPRFTDEDARVLYLKYLAGLVQAEVASGKKESDAVSSVIDGLEADGFIVTGAMLQKAKKLAREAAEAAFEETLRFRLGDEYDDIKNRHPKASPQQLRELRLCALRARENYRTQELRAGTRKALTEKHWLIIAAPVIVTVIAVIGGLIYGIFK